MILAASCIRKKGARTFTANSVSKISGEVLSRLPRVGHARRIDQDVDPAEAGIRCGHDAADVPHDTELGADHLDRHAAPGLDPVGHLLTFRCVAADGDDPCGAGLGEEPRNRRAHPLRAAGDDGHPSVDAVHCTTS